VTFLESLPAPKPMIDWTSWRVLWYTVPYLLAALFFASNAMKYRDLASTQQISLGSVNGCGHGTKGGYYCSYAFPVNGGYYRGDSSAGRSVQPGSNVDVYYDPQNPTTNSLKDFTDTCRWNRNAACIFIVIAAGFVARILYSRHVSNDQSRS
jgi:hypothetical protein